MKNRFFTKALTRAASLQGKPARLLSLAAGIVPRITNVQKRRQLAGDFKEGLTTFGRMMTAYARGRYRAVPGGVMLKLTAAVIYFVNPLDLVPDALIGIGLLDDAAVLSWVLRSAAKEIEKFRNWELTE